MLHSSQRKIDLAPVCRSGKHQVYPRIGEGEAIAIRDGWDILTRRVSWRRSMKESQPLVRNIEDHNSWVTLFLPKEEGHHILFYSEVGKVIAHHQHIQVSHPLTGSGA